MLPDFFWPISPFWHQKFAKIANFMAEFRPFFARFLLNFRQYLTPSTIFISFLCDNVRKNWNFTIFFFKHFQFATESGKAEIHICWAKKLLNFLYHFWAYPESHQKWLKKNLKIFGNWVEKRPKMANFSKMSQFRPFLAI